MRRHLEHPVEGLHQKGRQDQLLEEAQNQPLHRGLHGLRRQSLGGVIGLQKVPVAENRARRQHREEQQIVGVGQDRDLLTGIVDVEHRVHGLEHIVGEAHQHQEVGQGRDEGRAPHIEERRHVQQAEQDEPELPAPFHRADGKNQQIAQRRIADVEHGQLPVHIEQQAQVQDQQPGRQLKAGPEAHANCAGCRKQDRRRQHQKQRVHLEIPHSLLPFSPAAFYQAV